MPNFPGIGGGGIVGLQSTAAEIDGVVKRGNTMVILGDSLIAGNSISTNFKKTKIEGQVMWANHIAGNPFELVYNAGVGGETSAQILARVDTDVIAKKPAYCIWIAGINDPTSINGGNVNDANEALKANIIAIYEKLNAAGIYQFILTNTVTTNVVAKNKQAIFINCWMKNYFDNKPNCEVIDVFSALVIHTDANAYPVAAYMRDPVHYSNVGAIVLGKKIAAHFARFHTKTLPSSILEDWTINNTSLQLVKNPLGVGNTGYIGSGSTGVMPAYWYLYKMGNATVSAEKVARDDGFGEYTRITVTATDTTGYARIDTATTSPHTYLPKTGEKVYAVAEIEIESCTNLREINLKLYASNSLKMSLFADTNGGTIHPINITEPLKYTLKTDVFEFVQDESNLFVRIEEKFTAAGSVVFKIGRIAIYKVVE